MNYVQIYQAVQDYSENTESLFVNNISTFVQQAEERIYNSVQIPALRKNVTGNVSSGNQYLSLPDDYLSSFSVAVIDANNRYNYLLNKDVNFLREAYPTVVYSGTTYQGTPGGVPKYYALFGSQFGNANELSYILAPTPDANYVVELHYFYYPVSIVQGVIKLFNTPTGGSSYTTGVYPNIPLSGGQGAGATATITVAGGVVSNVALTNGGNFYTAGDVLTATSSYIGGTGSGFSVTVASVNNTTGTSWLGDNYDPVLLYGAMREAMLFMKGEQDLVKYYEDKYMEALQQLNRLGTGLERGDAYRDGQAKIKVNP
jgi:hypothetical protein